MRTVLSILLAALAGLLAALSLVGARAEALVHTPEPLQRIAGPMSQDPQLQAALTAELVEVVGDELPDGLPGFLQSGLTRLVEGAAGGLAADERFPAAWSQTVEQTRTDWVTRMDRLAAQSAEGAAGTVHLQTAPLVELGAERLSDALADALAGVPGAETVQERLEGAAGQVDPSVLAVDLSVPDPQVVDLEAVAWTVEHLHRWPWLAGASAVLALLALLIAPRRRRGTPLFVAGVTVLAVGAASRWALERMAPAPDLDGIARAAAASLLQGLRDDAMPDTLLLVAGGGILAALGLLIGLVSGLGARRGR